MDTVLESIEEIQKLIDSLSSRALPDCVRDAIQTELDVITSQLEEQ